MRVSCVLGVVWVQGRGRQPGIDCSGNRTHHIFDNCTKLLPISREFFSSKKGGKTPPSVYAKTLHIPEVLILTQKPLSSYVISTQLSWASTMPFVTSAERGGDSICFSHAVIRVMLTSLLLMFNSNLACNQYFISSTIAIKEVSQTFSLQHNKRIHPDLESFFFISPLPNCIWIFISFRLDAIDTSKNTPWHLAKLKLINHLNETDNLVSCWKFYKKIMLPQTWKKFYEILKSGNSF